MSLSPLSKMEKLGKGISRLGFGVMRLCQNQDGTFPKATVDLLHKAYKLGINYFDTGFEYLSGKSELLIRDVLVGNYPRESFYIADKMPIWRIKSEDDLDKIFSLQLERLGVSYIDFYLLHGLNSNYWEIVERCNVLSFLKKKKEEGEIRRIGFSFHDNVDVLEKILSSYEWDFCQLQINYYDWYAQYAKEKYYLCEKYKIPVMVMEPFGGGRLMKLPSKTKDIISEHGMNPPQMCLDFLKKLPNIAVILSGAVDEIQLRENIDIVNSENMIFDNQLYEQIVRIIQDQSAIPCTACKYCVKECPRQIDIPLCFQKYNDSKLLGIPSQYANLGIFYFNGIPEKQQAHHCIECRRCVQRCPQKLDIPNELKKVHRSVSESLLGMPLIELENRIKMGARIVCFGASGLGVTFQKVLATFGYTVDYFCDNDSQKWGLEVNGITIISPEYLFEIRERTMVFISSNYYKEIHEQLEKMGIDICN